MNSRRMAAPPQYAPKIERDMAVIDWRAPATTVSRTIRAYDPKPGAFSSLAGHQVKLLGARNGAPSHTAMPGQILDINQQGMTIACGDGTVQVRVVWPAGKKRMSPAEWQRGRGVAPGVQFDVVPAV